MNKTFIVIGVILALLVVTNTQGLAEEDVIYGCVGKFYGNLRIVSNPSECKCWETSISWNRGPCEPSPTLPDLVGTWDASSYNNGYSGETGRITFFDDNTFEIEGTLSVIIGCTRVECPAPTGTYEMFDGIIQLKLDGVNPSSGSEYTPAYCFPLVTGQNYISLTRAMTQAILKKSMDN
jgi:hypothetical protein